MNVREKNCEKKRQDIGHSELFISMIVSKNLDSRRRKKRKRKRERYFDIPPSHGMRDATRTTSKVFSMLNNKVSYG